MGEEIKMILQKGEYGILSTVGQDGKPYAVPLSYAWKEKCRSLLFHASKHAAPVQTRHASRHVKIAICFNALYAPFPGHGTEYEWRHLLP